jgi:hypothetical protein
MGKSLVGIVFGGLIGAVPGGLIGGLWFASICALLAGFMGFIAVSGMEPVPGEIRMVDTLRWSWTSLKSGSKVMIAVGLITVVAVIFSPADDRNDMIFGLLVATILVLLALGVTPNPVSQISYPGQRIALSLKNSLVSFTSTGLIFGLISGSWGGIFGAMIIALPLAPIAGLWFGGLAVIQHYALRYALAVNNHLPWRIISFLDYCTDRIFLRRVGGGYIFVHRSLMEHFASMYQEEPK